MAQYIPPKYGPRIWAPYIGPIYRPLYTLNIYPEYTESLRKHKILNLLGNYSSLLGIYQLRNAGRLSGALGMGVNNMFSRGMGVNIPFQKGAQQECCIDLVLLAGKNLSLGTP